MEGREKRAGTMSTGSYKFRGSGSEGEREWVGSALFRSTAMKQMRSGVGGSPFITVGEEPVKQP